MSEAEGTGIDSGNDTADRHRDEITRLVQAHEAPLYRFLVALSGDREVALDCVQDAFTRAYEHLRHGRTINTQWLYKVARNRAIDELRRRKRETRDMESLNARGSGSTIEDLSSMQGAFAQLSPDDRAILALAVEGLSGEEMANRLGIRPGAVRVRLLRARARFRTLYEGGRP